METIGIGNLARRAGVSIDTVRYYEKSGLLTPQARLPSGYRRYGASQVARLRFIRRAQELGFSLKDISEFDEVEKRIGALQRVQTALSELIEHCPGHGRAAACPILKALGAEIIE